MKQNLELRIKHMELNSHSKDEMKKLKAKKRYEEIFTEKKKTVRQKEEKKTGTVTPEKGIANMNIGLL